MSLKEADEAVTMDLQTNFLADLALSVSPGCPRPRVDTPGPQPQPMDLRVGQRPPVEPPPEPALLALQHPQHLHHRLFLAGLQPQRSVEPMRVKTELPAHMAALSPAPRPPPSLWPHPTLVSVLNSLPLPGRLALPTALNGHADARVAGGAAGARAAAASQ